MAIHVMYPVVDVGELEDVVNAQFGCEIAELRNLLFDDDYNNDCYKRFWYAEMEEYDERWMNPEDEEKVRLRNLVRAYLQDTIPDYVAVLIDVSW